MLYTLLEDIPRPSPFLLCYQFHLTTSFCKSFKKFAFCLRFLLLVAAVVVVVVVVDDDDGGGDDYDDDSDIRALCRTGR